MSCHYGMELLKKPKKKYSCKVLFKKTFVILLIKEFRAKTHLAEGIYSTLSGRGTKGAVGGQHRSLCEKQVELNSSII